MKKDHAMRHHDVVIVGGGHAGAQAAIALRQNGFADSVAIVGEEPELPYERPPLSKDYLAGEKPFERLLIRPSRFWEERRIELLLDRRVDVVEAAKHRIATSDGTRIGYGTLIWATGGAPRRISCTGHDLAGVHSVRSRADVDQLAFELRCANRVVVIGGGYIGLEAAAVLTKLGKQVTVLESQDRVLARVAGEPLSRFFEQEHRSHGVTIRLGVTVDCILEGSGRACAVRLGDGEVIDSHLVIVGIGISPSVAPLLEAGAEGGNGVRVDRQCRTSLPDVFAVGDCALHQNDYATAAEIRLESVQNANDQAGVAARTIVGLEARYDAVPWFWSNQFDLKLQTIGLSAGHDQALVRGRPADRSFSVVYLREGRVVALDCVNAVKDFVQGKALVAAHAEADPDMLVDPDIPLKSLIA